MATLPSRTVMPKDKAALFDRCFTLLSAWVVDCLHVEYLGLDVNIRLNLTRSKDVYSTRYNLSAPEN
jgi:hypothetical protein